MGNDRVPAPTNPSPARVRNPERPRSGPEPVVGHGLIASLQGSAGNRAATSMLDRRDVQRHTGPTLNEEVGFEPGTGTGTGGGGPDYAALVAQIKEAIEGLGTDEAAVMSALRQLDRDPTKIAAFGMVYATVVGRTLEADLRDDLDGAELAAAIRLITPPSRQELIQAQMWTTASGIWALSVIARHSIPVDYEYSGTGSFHQAGRIYLNRNVPVAAAAIVMMHEAQHALTFKSGLAADIATLTRDEYVTAKIADEAEAVVRAIEGASPMAARGVSLASSGVTAGLITQYETAHAAEVTRLQAADSSLSAATAASRARTTVRNGLVTRWFHDGTFMTSTGPLTYSDHYGGAWDRAHAPPAAAATTTPAPEAGG